MTQGPGRFEFYLTQLDDLLLNAARSEDPALFLYNNDARTKLFMLEGLAKLYEGLHDKKLFGRLKEEFKKVEDLIGAIDYYDSFSKDFLSDPEMPVTVRIFTEEKRDEKLKELNTLLLKRKWINHEPDRIRKIRKKLRRADWEQPEKEIARIRKFYIREIKSIRNFFIENGQFSDIESQVHSLRRKLRWLSIYPQALQGAIQFATEKEEEDTKGKLKQYLTPEIVNSPFNKMPARGDETAILYLNKNYFLALSFMIAELGEIKDEGLRILASAEAAGATQFLSAEKALERAYELNHSSTEKFQALIHRAQVLLDNYFRENNLENILTVQEKKEDFKNEALEVEAKED